MEFTGRILKVFPPVTGVSKAGNEWKKQEFIFEFFENSTDRWSDKVLFSLMNQSVDEHNLIEGEEVRIGFCHAVREYNERFFNELRLYRLEKVSYASRIAPQATDTATMGNHTTESEKSAQTQEKEDNMPF